MAKRKQPKRFTPLASKFSRLRTANFVLLFAIVGALFVIISGAAPLVGFYGSVEKDQLDRINYARYVNGRASLHHVECLNTVAENWTKQMADARGISHNLNLASHIDSACGSSWSLAAENVGVDYDSAKMFTNYMNSTLHKNNILDGRFTKVGVGAYWGPDGRLYVAHVFATCTNCSGTWATNASLPADPVAPVAPAVVTGNSFYARNSNTSGAADFSFKFGNVGDVPVACDWDGNGTETIGVYRNGVFYLSNNNSTAALSFGYGNPTDTPICGDWDGNGTDTIGVYRASESTFYLRNTNSTGGADVKAHYGVPGDKPLVGDWDGNGTDTIGVSRGPSFYLRNSNTKGAGDISLGYGNSGDVPLVGDWDGNGTDTIGVYRPSNAVFYLRNANSTGGADVTANYGISTDKPFVADWDGNKTTTIGIRR